MRMLTPPETGAGARQSADFPAADLVTFATHDVEFTAQISCLADTCNTIRDKLTVFAPK